MAWTGLLSAHTVYYAPSCMVGGTKQYCDLSSATVYFTGLPLLQTGNRLLVGEPTWPVSVVDTTAAVLASQAEAIVDR